MKKITILTIIFILTVLTNTLTNTGICLGSDTNVNPSLNGSVWTDINANGVQESDENNMADATVFVKNLGSGEVTMHQTDAQGYFIIDTLSSGEYSVWSENANGVATDAQVVELNEVGGTSILDVIFEQAELAGQTQTAFNIFLPIINN